MFIDAPVEYTKTQVACKDNVVIERFMAKDKNVVFYANSSFSVVSVAMYTGYTKSILKRYKPAPSGLKRAMFRSSSKGISKALKRS